MTPTTQLGCALATAATTALLVVPAPALAAGHPQKLATTYACTSAYADGDTSVGVQTRLPSSVAAGRTVGAKRADVLVVVPEELTTTFRQYGVQSFSGTASKASLRVGARSVALSGLRIPTTTVPASGRMVLPASGRSESFAFGKPGTRPVTAPARFTLHLVGTTADGSYPLDVSCSLADGANDALGSLRVVR